MLPVRVYLLTSQITQNDDKIKEHQALVQQDWIFHARKKGGKAWPQRRHSIIRSRRGYRVIRQLNRVWRTCFYQRTQEAPSTKFTANKTSEFRSIQSFFNFVWCANVVSLRWSNEFKFWIERANSRLRLHGYFHAKSLFFAKPHPSLFE